MYIYVDRSGQISLREDKDFAALKLVTELSYEHLFNAFNQRGNVVLADDSTHVWLLQSWFLAQKPAKDPEWRQNFERMWEYASKKGWTHSAIAAVRVHLDAACINPLLSALSGRLSR
jgi:hypothetical protein